MAVRERLLLLSSTALTCSSPFRQCAPLRARNLALTKSAWGLPRHSAIDQFRVTEQPIPPILAITTAQSSTQKYKKGKNR